MRKPEPQPMGFMLASPATEKTRMQVIASLKADVLEKLSGGLKSADGLIIDSASAGEIKAIEKFCQAEDSIPAGRRLKETDDKAIKKLLETSCDFGIFNSGSPVSAVRNEKIGKILELDLNLSDSLLRAAGDLPIDAVITASGIAETSLTLQDLMVIQRLVYMISKPILVSISGEISSPELQSLWDMGICGVVIEVTDSKSVDRLAEIRQKIETLDPPAFLKKPRMTAILPQSQAGKPEPEEDEGEEEEDE